MSISVSVHACMNDVVVSCYAMLVWQSQRTRPCSPIHSPGYSGFIKLMWRIKGHYSRTSSRHVARFRHSTELLVGPTLFFTVYGPTSEPRRTGLSFRNSAFQVPGGEWHQTHGVLVRINTTEIWDLSRAHPASHQHSGLHATESGSNTAIPEHRGGSQC